jgi:hypothetical protein
VLVTDEICCARTLFPRYKVSKVSLPSDTEVAEVDFIASFDFGSAGLLGVLIYSLSGVRDHIHWWSRMH